ncbi:AsmA-like C-terminal region-containing protein, partial [Roseibium sp. RKSG952]
LTSNDAGAVLSSAGLLTQAREGNLRVQLDPIAEAGNYDVDLKITDTRIKDAPAMAALLNAISLVGLLTEMAGQGIYFSSIDSKMRITPTEVKVLSGSAVGPSMGLSFDGTVDTVRQTLNLRGAISPIYLVNAIGSVLTRKGEGIFAFNYTLTGPIGSPQVSVNPLSGLAPLFLRDLMRGPRPTVSDGPNAQPQNSGGTQPTQGTRGEDR